MFTQKPRLHGQRVTLLVTPPDLLQRAHPLSGMGYSLNASKDIFMGVTNFALTCGSDPVMDTVCIAVVVGSARTGRVLDAGSDREVRSPDVCHVGDTR